MRIEEKWISWKPLNNLTGEYHEELICDGTGGLKIHLYQKHNEELQKLQIQWPRSVISYKVTNETYMDQIFNDLRMQDPTYAGGIFFKILNSEYIKNLSYSSGSLSDYMSLTHFVILSSDSVIEIIADYEPKIELI